MSGISTLAIGITKTAYTKHLLLDNDVPEILRSTPPETYGEQLHWYFDACTWIGRDKHTQQLLEFFIKLDREDRGFRATRHNAPVWDTATEMSYGAMRVGQRLLDIECWGHPDTFNLFCQRTLITPFHK